MADFERFQRTTAGHAMTVIRNEGIHRHLRFRDPGSSSYWFDVITWPGALCVDGDCGTYVFRRIEDMFDFFRTKPGSINPHYWSEKCIASDTRSRGDGIHEWDPDGFTRNVVHAFREWWRDSDDELRPHRLRAFKQLREEVLQHVEDENASLSALGDFEYVIREASQSYYAAVTTKARVYRVEEYWELGAKRFTWSFLWNLHAIVKAVAEFDAAQTKEEPAHATRT